MKGRGGGRCCVGGGGGGVIANSNSAVVESEEAARDRIAIEGSHSRPPPRSSIQTADGRGHLLRSAALKTLHREENIVFVSSGGGGGGGGGGE